MERRKRFLRIVLAAIAAVALLLPTLFPILSARAETVAELEAKLSQAQKARAEAQSGLTDVKNKITNAKSKRESLDVEISNLETELYALNAQIAENEAAVQEITAELEAAEKNAEAYEDTFKERVRVMYERKNVSFLSILFGSKSFADLLKRAEMVAQIVQYDKTVMRQMADAQAKIEEKKTALEEAGKAVELSREIVQTKYDELDANKKALSTVISSLQADEASYRAVLDEADAAENALRDEIRKLTSSGSSPAPAAAEGQFAWPTPSTKYITSPYGTRYHPVQKRMKTHTGIDIGAGHGASIVAAATGTVLRAGWNSGYGNYIVIDHGGGIQTLYGHCSALLVQSGQSVVRGDQIALVGSTGVSTGPHLHFEVLKNGAYTDPMSYFE